MGKGRILVIDDSVAILRAIKVSLEKVGYSVTTLSTPAGFGDVLDLHPDLILVDVNMPELYGDDAVEFFRQEWKITAPIYLCSEIPEEELRQRAKTSGASGYVCKSWGIEALVNTVARILPAR